MENQCVNCECSLNAFKETYPLWNQTPDKLCSKCRKKAYFFLSEVHAEPSALEFFNLSKPQLSANGFGPQGLQHLEEYCKYLDKLPPYDGDPPPVWKPDKIESQEKAKPIIKNKVASIFTVMAWIIFIVGFLIGFAALFDNGFISLICWASSFVSGMFFIGFAEIIRLLQKISDK